MRWAKEKAKEEELEIAEKLGRSLKPTLTSSDSPNCLGCQSYLHTTSLVRGGLTSPPSWWWVRPRPQGLDRGTGVLRRKSLLIVSSCERSS